LRKIERKGRMVRNGKLDRKRERDQEGTGAKKTPKKKSAELEGDR